jgi:hypothetical protein
MCINLSAPIGIKHNHWCFAGKNILVSHEQAFRVPAHVFLIQINDQRPTGYADVETDIPLSTRV